jgi:Uma2 family endonuclease
MNPSSSTTLGGNIPMPDRLTGPVMLFDTTAEVFLHLPPSELFPLELLAGTVVMLPPHTPAHQYYNLNFGAALNLWVSKQQLGLILAGVNVQLHEKWVPTPDLIFLATKNLARVMKRRIEGPVDLAVEILSSSGQKRDRITKQKAYAEFGIPWYWIVDLKKRVLIEMAIVGQKYDKIVHCPFDTPFQPRMFPGLVLNLAEYELKLPTAK